MSKSILINRNISKLKNTLYDTRNNNCFLTCHKVCFLTVNHRKITCLYKLMPMYNFTHNMIGRVSIETSKYLN